MDWSLAIAAATLELVVLSSAIGVVWKLARSEAQMRAEYTREIAEAKAESLAAITAQAAKLYQVEIWARDEFVRKGSFETVVARLERSMELMGTKVETAVKEMTAEIKALPHREH